MKITRENQKDGKVKLTIEVEKGKIELASDEVYKKLAGSIKVAGFRPGKAPKNIVEKEVGSERFQAEILDIVLPQTYYDAIISEKLDAVGAPEVKIVKFVPSDGLIYEALVELMPQVKVPDYTKISVKREAVKVTSAEVDEVLADLAKQLQKFSTVDRAAVKGDRVEIDFEGFVGGVPFEGGKSQNHPLILGSGSFIPGFEEQLEGMKIEDEKEIEVKFPDDYHAENLKGKKATFKVRVHTVEEIILPEMTDAFAKEVGPFEDLKGLKADIEKQLQFSKETQERRRVEDDILEKLAGKANFKVPENLVSQEQHRMLHEAEGNLAQQGIGLAQYLEMIKKSQEDLESEMKPEAEKRVKIGMLLTQMAKDEKFEATEKEVDAYIEERVKIYPEGEQAEARKHFESHDGRHTVENSIIGNKVLELLYTTCSK